MIVHRAGAALLLRDGYTALPLASGAEVFSWLDGRQVRPMWKPGGWLVLTDLQPGTHILRLCHRWFREETLTLITREDSCIQDEICLLPGAQYPFRGMPVRLELKLTQGKTSLGEETVWIGLHGQTQLKLAQEGTAGGETAVKLFYKGPAERLPVPGWFLIADPKGAEAVHLNSLRGDTGLLSGPVARAHSRGTLLIPAQRYLSDQMGQVTALFRQSGPVSLLCRTQYKQVELPREGSVLSWKLGKETENG